MQLKTVSYAAYLTPEIRRRHRHTRLKERVLSFTVQLETLVKDKWFPIVRYDTTHGFAHKHLLHFSGETEQTPLFSYNFSEALDFAEADIKTNWKLYMENFLKEAGND